jgi:hypothetical protein
MPHVNFCIALLFNVAGSWTVWGYNPGGGQYFPRPSAGP